MPEAISDKKVFSLLEVTRSIQKTLTERYRSPFWVKAEMNKLNHYPHTGHCYPDLVEKKDGKIISQMKSNLWKDDFNRINERFLSILKEPIKDGIKILFCAHINFHPAYGLSLQIIEIDPGFSLGELEREKQETIQKITLEGIFANNKKLRLALLPQRIAVISVETSRGYADFLKVLDDNPWGYKFFNVLFPSLLQGEKSVASILHQLKRIKKAAKHFDAVAIIRGGGGDVGLSSYNNYELAREVALFPIPIVTGIGHSTNETVVEMISFKNAITPTELADFLIQKFHDFSVPVKRAEEVIIDKSKRMLKEEQLKFRNAVKFFLSGTNTRLQRSHNDIQSLSKSLIQQSKFLIKHESQSFDLFIQGVKKYPYLLMRDKRQKIIQLTSELQKHAFGFMSTQKGALQNLDKNIHNLNPVNILRRGFSITLHNGKAVTQYSAVKIGDSVTTVLAEGRIVSEVKTSKKSS